jgi:hypothetical protein
MNKRQKTVMGTKKSGFERNTREKDEPIHE